MLEIKNIKIKNIKIKIKIKIKKNYLR